MVNAPRRWGMIRFACLGMVAALGLLCLPARAEWRNALQPSGKPAGRVKVVQAGQARGAIYCPAVPTPQETNAAADLQHWIREMTGVTVPVRRGEPGGHAIVLRTDATLGSDGYALEVRRGRLLVSGGRGRGVVNAVYALLEEDLGCRFYAGEAARVPKTNTLALAPVARRYVPKLRLRDPFYACAFDPVWSRRNRTDAPSAPVPEVFGGRTDYGGMFVHTIGQIVPPDAYLKEHPEYFALNKDGTRLPAQVCPTEPGVARVAIAYVRRVLAESSHVEILSVSKNDNGGDQVCHCERCRKLREAEGSDMANQLCLVNQVADAIAADHPHVAIDTLAYLETIQVPRTIRPRSNVVIRLCNDNVGAWAHPFTPASACDVARLVAAWGAAHPRLSIWDYNVNFSHYLAPMPNIDVMAANIRFWVRHHAEGVMLQGGYQGPAERDELKSWVTAKLLWNPDWDERALTQDFIWGYYGPAAPALAAYEELLEKTFQAHAREMAAPPGGIRYPMDAPFLTREFVDQAAALFREARTLVQGDATLLRRVERAELPILYVQCVRGPAFVGPTYGARVAEFERLARQEKIQFLQEGGPDFEPKLAGYKALVPKP